MVTTQPPKIKRKGTLALGVGLSLIGSGISDIRFNGVNVSISYGKLRIFARETTCALCKKVRASFFAVEKHGENSNSGSPWGLYLYGKHVDTGNLVLFTVDHKKAKARNGGNGSDNLQTMCQPCNLLKAHYDVDGLTYEEVVFFRAHMDYELNHHRHEKMMKLVQLSDHYIKLTDNRATRGIKLDFVRAIRQVEPALRQANEKGT